MGQFDKVVFFNHGHLGDTIISKFFIREVKKYIPSRKYALSNFYDDSYVLDVVDEHIPLNLLSIPTDTWIAEDKESNTLYFNTWFGTLNQPGYLEQLGLSQSDRQHLRSEDGVLYNWESYVFYFTIALKLYNPNLDLYYMLENKLDYVPAAAQQDISNIPLLNDSRTKVLIFNQQATSGQADNDNFIPYIDTLSQNENLIIYTSKDTGVRKHNLISLPDHISHPDLNKIAYLSTFCKYICGPGNAPLQNTWIKQNLTDVDKTYIVINRNDAGEAILFGEAICENIVVNKTKDIFDTLIKKL